MEVQHKGVQNKTAETWDSYAPTLLKVIKALKPKRALEFGSGKSTKTISELVDSLDSVEHNPAWLRKYTGKNVKHILQQDPNKYYLTRGRYDEYDLIFIDGIKREECLEEAKQLISTNGAVIIHDAERPKYRKYIEMYEHVYWEDDGHTAVMTRDDEVSYKLLLALTIKPGLK